MSPPIREFCISYSTTQFEETGRFLKDIVGFDIVSAWDNERDGCGAYYHAGGNGLIEIMDAASPGGWAPPPPAEAFFVMCTVDSAAEWLARLTNRGATLDHPLTEEAYGAYFGIRDPNGVMYYFMERRGESKLRFQAYGLPQPQDR